MVASWHGAVSRRRSSMGNLSNQNTLQPHIIYLIHIHSITQVIWCLTFDISWDLVTCWKILIRKKQTWWDIFIAKHVWRACLINFSYPAMCLLMACPGDKLRVGTQTYGHEDVHTDRHRQPRPKLVLCKNVCGSDEDNNGNDDHMEMLFTLLSLYEGKPQSLLNFPHEGKVLLRFYVFFDDSLNIMLNKRSSCLCFEILCDMWCYCNVVTCYNDHMTPFNMEDLAFFFYFQC